MVRFRVSREGKGQRRERAREKGGKESRQRDTKESGEKEMSVCVRD